VSHWNNINLEDLGTDARSGQGILRRLAFWRELS
jgi:hypothetical protein